MDTFEILMAKAADIIAEYDTAKRIAAESSDYAEREKARELVVGIREIFADMRSAFLGPLAGLDQIAAHAERTLGGLPERERFRQPQIEAVVRRLLEISRETDQPESDV